MNVDGRELVRGLRSGGHVLLRGQDVQVPPHADWQQEGPSQRDSGNIYRVCTFFFKDNVIRATIILG